MYYLNLSMGEEMTMFKLAAVGMLALAAGTASANGFTNGGFEDGSTAGWTTGGGYRGGTLNSELSPGMLLPGGSLNGDAGDRGQIIDSSYLDPNIGAALGSTVYAGKYSYRAEDTTNGGYGTTISQKVTNYTDSKIYFAWKAVLENGGHEENESAVMQLTLTDNTTNELLISRTYNAGDGGGGVDSRFSTQDNLFYTANWQIEQLAIDGSRSGHDFTLSLLAADCEPTGHTGYAYLDGFGAANPVPEPETYAMLIAGLGLLGFMKRRKA
jgi:hypothetical protein